MGRAEYVQKRKREYMAQVLAAFEASLEEPLRSAGLNGQIDEFKDLVRSKMTALAVDAVDIFTLEGEQVQNDFARDVRDQIGS